MQMMKLDQPSFIEDSLNHSKLDTREEGKIIMHSGAASMLMDLAVDDQSDCKIVHN